ncbi:MAG TPA: UDP-N-acetylglucosamine 2-epimerase [Humisphaera sp.]|jgi:UDP-N-acetylglucosamine 2-epimerase (non-hydrolysing)/GDP/UDP-N,N'-diacetylbacillosamine 2-epimerase (hydrolysing)|nr:UDP-N-acetylglucosamine 2-epimerase [Humisphaera sp.]
MTSNRRICFVTGTRAEFGLMKSVLRRIEDHPKLALQIVATGMHLDKSRGSSLDEIRAEGWKIDAIVPWAKGYSQSQTAIATGRALAGLAEAFDRLASDIILVVGDRVEAFAAASAAHISGRLVAHVHGGDRALGLVDDSLRHAITKLAHIHFPATVQSAKRIAQLGEDRWRIFRAGSPGLDGIRADAEPWKNLAAEFPELVRRRYVLLVLHPQSAQDEAEYELADQVLRDLQHHEEIKTIIIFPNNDPGSAGIVRRWETIEKTDQVILRRTIPRGIFLGLMRDAVALVGNSSSGIIEAASFGTPVIDIGHRQKGRERGPNVAHVNQPGAALRRALDRLLSTQRPIRFPPANIYGEGNAGQIIARTLASVPADRFRRKLISY